MATTSGRSPLAAFDRPDGQFGAQDEIRRQPAAEFAGVAAPAVGSSPLRRIVDCGHPDGTTAVCRAATATAGAGIDRGRIAGGCRNRSHPAPVERIAAAAGWAAPLRRVVPPCHSRFAHPNPAPGDRPGDPCPQLARFLPHLNRTLREYQIDTPLRIAHFLAQIAHESDGFNTAEEYASGAAYEGRLDLGNTQPGDGRRFKGRGLIQVTGRANYGEAGRALGVDLLNNPTRLAEADLATRSAGWFWQSRRLNAHADRDDIYTVTRRINGGYNGLADRQNYLARAKRVLPPA
ncbi:MAG: glycoside hydrolase family 19 protein [Oscillatoriales cyanobacterium SM2_1_8]|nr:glycoside hydrolase family 19 protein [Oscillatoriales cyanobacterium SM2_1_8]